jgi:hypothetical protein
VYLYMYVFVPSVNIMSELRTYVSFTVCSPILFRIASLACKVLYLDVTNRVILLSFFVSCSELAYIDSITMVRLLFSCTDILMS